FQLAQFAAAGDTYYIDDVRLEKVENYHSIYDINNDGIVNIYDLFRVSKHFGENTTIPYPAYDVNEDGKVDISDLILVGSNII
ncbi:MAG: Dockerin type I repeat protein, partial [Candidatus Methanoperedens nitroreducens]